ncbi:1-phosphofructokinase [Bacillaceae bacterium Marseille-Q3522]|nr:1-phosphofructokinase [Bacillaceae bacterium Marseille-Q3522]
MIYTLTLNPSVDYIVELPQLSLGGLNRTVKEAKFPGGKGINVSRVLKRIGVTSSAIGFIGGFTGKYVKDFLHGENIDSNFVEVSEDTRINIKLKTDKETEVNAKGPQISAADFQELKNRIAALTGEDLLVLAGSIPTTMPETTYEELVRICAENGTRFVVDAEGDLLRKVLPYKPFFIKPNHHELGGLFKVKISSCEQAIPYARKLLQLGAENVLVSLAGNGAVFVNKEMVLTATVPKGEVQSSVGAGDSMVAGFLAKYVETNQFADAFRYGVASGSATAFSLGLCKKEKIEQLLPQVVLKEKN